MLDPGGRDITSSGAGHAPARPRSIGTLLALLGQRMRARRLALVPRVSVITLGVADLRRARAFYEALGWETDSPADADVAFFPSGSMVFALWARERLAADSGVAPGDGYGDVTLAHNVGSPAEVDAVLAMAGAAGATIARDGGETFWGGYSGVFLDLDGHPWEVAHNPHWTLDADGGVTLPS